MEPREDLAALHQEVLANDPTAPIRLFEALRESLPAWLYRKFGSNVLTRLDCEDHAVDALMVYLGAPAKYDPARATLITYLFQIARSAILRRFDRDKKRAAFTREAVELEKVDVYNEKEGPLSDGPAEAYDLDKARQEVAARRPRIQLANSEEAAFDLMAKGERSTKAFAMALGLTALPAAEQKIQVKRFKDRMSKRMNRLKDASDGH